MLTTGWQLLRGLIKQAGPYMLIELLLPGGTLLAFLLFIARSGAFNALQPMPVLCRQDFQCQVLVESQTARLTPPLWSTRFQVGQEPRR
jgi:hypothetical protein